MADLLEMTKKRSQGNNDGVYEYKKIIMPTLGEMNADKDNQIINAAKKFDREMRQFFPDEKCGYAMGLHNTYDDIMQGKSKLNAGVQEYIKESRLKDKSTFIGHFIQHKDAPKTKLDTKA